MTDILEGHGDWRMVNEDCIEHMARMPEHSVDFAVFSPPFPSLFSYTSLEADIGNSDSLKYEAPLHLMFFFRQLVRVLKPGRVACIHLMQIPALARNQESNTWDFRGIIIRLAKRCGFSYDIDWVITKNPQAQAIRTHSHRLLFVTLGRDRSVTCPAFVDYIVKIRAPGENEVPINSDCITRNQWIEWAEGAWTDIQETDTLNVREGKGDDDTKHICPLQLEVIRRLVLLYTNPGEIVFSPFAGIGSEGYMALGGRSPKTKKRVDQQRRFYGCELKPEYFNAACENLRRAESQYSNDSERLLFL